MISANKLSYVLCLIQDVYLGVFFSFPNTLSYLILDTYFQPIFQQYPHSKNSHIMTRAAFLLLLILTYSVPICDTELIYLHLIPAQHPQSFFFHTQFSIHDSQLTIFFFDGKLAPRYNTDGSLQNSPPVVICLASTPLLALFPLCPLIS